MDRVITALDIIYAHKCIYEEYMNIHVEIKTQA